jgi:hypothetical protein
VIGLTCTFGFSASNSRAIWSNALLSEAAAKTVSSPLTVEAAAVAVGVGVAAGEASPSTRRASAAASTWRRRGQADGGSGSS